MNTQEVIATDRVPVQARPSPVLMNMYTGGSGGMQAYYPDSAVTWGNVGLQAVPMVLEADRRHLKILIHSFDQQQRMITMRPLELDTGVYEVRIDGERHEDFHLAHRFEPLQLSFPPQTTSLVEVAQLESRPLPDALPDLALSETECLLDRSRNPPVLRVRVHNVGIRDSGPATITFTALSEAHPPSRTGVPRMIFANGRICTGQTVPTSRGLPGRSPGVRRRLARSCPARPGSRAFLMSSAPSAKSAI